jgi:hypothetical protein
MWSRSPPGCAARRIRPWPIWGETIASLEGQLAGLGRQRLRAAMGTRAFDAGYAAGLTLDLAQAAAALGSADTAAGQARVAVSGKAATVLTPRELDVLELVA